MTEESRPASGTAKIDDVPKPLPLPEAAAPAEVTPAKVEPTRQPITPQRASAENRRNDLFIMAAVAVTAFLLGFLKITDSDLWLHLKAGWQIDQQGIPTNDSFAYTTAGQSWVNPHWLYDWGLYRLELIEARMQVRRLVTDYKALLDHALTPALDAQGNAVEQSLTEEQRQQLGGEFDKLLATANTTDTYQMRQSAERTADQVRAAGLQLPRSASDSGRSAYSAIAAYNGPGGETLIRFDAAVILKSLVLVAMAAVLLFVRHPGPTRWWAAAVAAVALVGMSDRFNMSPSVFGLLGLAIVFWILHTYQNGRNWVVWLLIPLQLLWVNIDPSFALGFAIVAIALAYQIVAQGLGGRSDSSARQGSPIALAIAFVLSLIATMSNRFGLGAWAVPYDWSRFVLGRSHYVAANIASLFGSTADWIKDAQASGNDLLTLAPDMFTPFSPVYVRLLQGFVVPPLTALVVIALAFASFLLNRRRFRLDRFLMLLLCVTMFAFATRYVAIAVLTAAVMLSLNGQEWYLDRFGGETRITRGWLLWSQAGRAVTVLAVVAISIAGITSWLGSAAGSDFGSGIQWVQYDFGPGRFLRHAKLKGNALTTIPAQGNLLIWSNHPPSQVFLDSRESLHRNNLAEFEALKMALLEDDRDVWPDVLDKYRVSHVILNITNIADRVRFPRTFARMNNDPKWRLVNLSANSAIFGRVDLDEGHPLAEDAAWFEKNQFDPARLVYAQDDEPLPEPPGPVTAPSWIDRFWQTRRVLTPQAILAGHYLTPTIMKTPPSAEEATSTGPIFVVPTENCFLAIRDARRGLAKESRVSPFGYAVLSKAYYYLYNMEMAVAPNEEIHNLRLLQVVTALNQLVAANPKDPIAQLQLALRYRRLGFLDLADQHLDALLQLWRFEDEPIENLLFDGGQRLNLTRADVQRESDRIKADLERVQYEMDQLGSQLANPLTKATYLISRGCPAKAIEQLNEAAAFGVGADVSPLLARLYLRIGQPGDADRGADHEMINMQGSGAMRPGEKEELWALIKLTQGDYERARSYMEAAIADARISMAKNAILSFTTDLRSGTIPNLAFAPIESVDDVDRVIRMEYHLGLMHLEAGEPGEAAKHFKQSLAIREDNPFRPVIAFYLAKITGEKLEPLPPKDDEDMPESATGGPEKSEPVPPAQVPAKPADEPRSKQSIDQ